METMEGTEFGMTRSSVRRVQTEPIPENLELKKGALLTKVGN